MEAAAKLSTDAIIQGQDARDAVRAALQTNPIVFAATKHETQTSGQFNPNINIVLEDLAGFPQLKSGEDYLAHGRAAFGSEPSMSFVDAGQTRDIGGLDFAGHTQVISMMNFNIRGRQYARKFGDVVMIITLSADTPADLQDLEATLDAATFTE